MNKNHTLISLSNITKEQLDELKTIYGKISYDKLISILIVEIYKKQLKQNEL